MYEQISGNIWRSRLLILLFIAFFAAIGYVFARVQDNILMLPLAIVVAAVMTVGSFYYSDRIVLASVRARPAEKSEFPHYVNVVEEMAIAGGLPLPRAYVMDDPSPNAFATGRDPEHAVVCVTTGLLSIMNRNELQGVIAHEMSHIKNFDIRFMMLVAVLVGAIALMADWFWWSGRLGHRSRDDENSQGQGIWLIVGLVLAILAPLSAMLIQAAISRRREYLADASGAMMSRFPDGLADALEKLRKNDIPLQSANKATAHLFISNPLGGRRASLSTLFATHPPIEDRIERLRAM